MHNSPNAKESLLGHLESIRTLLDQDAQADLAADIDLSDTAEFVQELEEQLAAERLAEAEAATDQNDDDNVPVLQVEAPQTLPSLQDATLQHLLGSAWQEETDVLLAAARSQIARSQEDWNPEDTAELSDALKVRIDATVNDWLNRTLLQQLGDLRSNLLSAVGEELNTQLDQRLAQNAHQRLDKEERLIELSKPFLDNDCA